ncbi:MAG: PstS family phosphate ABC transporter substrate-binding protein [Parahaliea sp.]
MRKLGLGSKPGYLLVIFALSIFTALKVHGGAAEDMVVNTVEKNRLNNNAATVLSGNLTSVGSDTLANLMSIWAEDFKRFYPAVNIQIQAAGSSTAPPALIEGTASLGPMSRLMKAHELDAFERRFGYQPTAIAVAIDALALYVHQDNPLAFLTITQIDALFSSTRRCGAKDPVLQWGDLGLKGSWTNRKIQLFGRNSASGTYGHFKMRALCNGDFNNNLNEQPGSASVVQSVSVSLGGLGYAGIGYRSAGVRALPIAVAQGLPLVTPTRDHAMSGRYPLSRFLYIYVNKVPGEALPPMERAFFHWILSAQGQRRVVGDGYIPLPADALADARQQLGL